MKHNLRMAFLSLLLVLTLGVMPVFAESAGVDERPRQPLPHGRDQRAAA